LLLTLVAAALVVITLPLSLYTCIKVTFDRLMEEENYLHCWLIRRR